MQDKLTADGWIKCTLIESEVGEIVKCNVTLTALEKRISMSKAEQESIKRIREILARESLRIQAEQRGL